MVRSAVPRAGRRLVVLAGLCAVLLAGCADPGAPVSTGPSGGGRATAWPSGPSARPSTPTVPPSTPAADGRSAAPTDQAGPDPVESSGDEAWARAEALVADYYWRLPAEGQIPERRARAAEVWADALATECPAEGPVSCAPDTFAPVVWTDGMVYVLDTSVEVAAEDPVAVRAALEAAAGRFLLIDSEGSEWTWEELVAAEDEGLDAYVFTPPYVSALEESDGAIGFWFDVEGNPYPRMARAEVRVLLEELARAGVTEARIRPLASAPYR